MNGGEINDILCKHITTGKNFLKCWPSNMIPSSRFFPYSVVINTDVAGKDGIHWVCVYVPNADTVEYFDSFALDPIENIATYLARFPNVVKSKVMLQTIGTEVCGQYCIYFLIRRSSGYSLKMVEDFLRKRGDRDKYVGRFVQLL